MYSYRKAKSILKVKFLVMWPPAEPGTALLMQVVCASLVNLIAENLFGAVDDILLVSPKALNTL